ncbi:MAG: hypothetical protein WCK00_05340 [Deltaproteobacteria bacterium]
MQTLVSSRSTAPTVPACVNEDGITQNPLYDYNGILDPGEDQNANSRLDPGNVASVTAATTDNTGHSTVSLVYARDYAAWINIRLEVRASLAGSTTSASQSLVLPGLAADYSDIKIYPPGSTSPFGSNTTCYAALSVMALDPTRISLNWDPSAYASSYNIYRDKNESTPVAVKIQNVTRTTYEDIVTAGATYCYEIKQVNSSGELPLSPTGNRVCVGSQAVAPASVTVTTLSPTQIQVSWGDAGAASYRIYRGGIRIQDSVARSILDASLSANTQYCYAVSSLTSEGVESTKSSTVCATTQLTSAPLPPTALSVTAATSSQINLSWTASSGAAGYRIYKNGTYLKSVTSSPTSDKELTDSTVYCYSVKAYDLANSESAETIQLCAATYGPPPPDPVNLTTFVELPGKVILNWSASASATGYYIYRNDVKIATISTGTATTYTDTGATANSQNIYRVTAVDATGSESSGVLNQVTVNTALTVPTMGSATANTSTQITIGWTNAGAGTGVAGYNIYRNGVYVQTIPSAATLTYADNTLSASTQYCYRVSAIDASSPVKESAQSRASFCATTYGAGSMVLSLTKSSDDSATTSVSIDSPAKLTATVKDSVGSAIVGAVVKFSTISDLSFNPASGTALTDATGKVTITVNAGNTTGATTIGAATTDAYGTAISKNINLSVTPPNLSLSALTITPAILSAGGSAGVSITVNDGAGNPFTTSVPISFTSDGVKATKATITAQVYTVNGVASATYRDINYATVDTITATLTIGGTTFTKTGTFTVNAAAAGSISFISATPANIALKGTGGTGRSETSVVVFKVLDTNGNPIRKTVNFSLLANTTIGGLALTAASADSDPVTGLVQTIVQAGTVSTPVRVAATIALTAISTTSDQLVISTGIPDQDSFSIAISTHNIEAWNDDGITSVITVRLADHFNNPAPDGTAVYFRSSGGSVQPSCTTTAGTCTVTFTSGAPRPANGRVVILAYALGEESFVDLNGNGIYDTTIPDTFTDMPEPFLDANENGTRDATEEIVDTNNDTFYSPADGKFNGILRDASLTGPTTIHVRGSATVVLSGSDAVIKIDGATAPPARNIIPVCTPGVAWTPGSVSFNVVVADVNGNVMPAGTTIAFNTTNGTIIHTALSYTVPKTSTAPPTYPVTIQSDATQGSGPGFACTNTITSGTFTVTVSTPNGIKSYQYVTIND